jgi:hypothetical protein
MRGGKKRYAHLDCESGDVQSIGRASRAGSVKCLSILITDDTVHMWAGTTLMAVASRAQKRMETSICDHMVAA